MAKFTQEEYEKAKEVNLFDYLQQNGYKLNKKGKEYCLEEHDSLCINKEKNTWFWHRQNKGGSVIQFLQEYEKKTLVEAIYTLNNKSNIEQRAYTKYEPIEKEEKGELILPLKNEDNRRVQAYLSKNRGIDFEIVNSFIKQGLIYESRDKHEAVFISRDKKGNIKYASKRSTLTNNSFRQDVSNSDKQYGFKTIGNSDKVFVFESPIDLLSHCTLAKMQGKNWKDDNRISLGGVSDVALNKFLEENPNIKEIILFLDNDKAGIESANKICKKYGLDYKVSIFTTKYKDLNETLVKFKEEKLQNENIKLKDYIIKCKNPFIEPRLQDKEILRNYFKEITKDIEENSIDNLIDKELLSITEDNKAILFIKNSSGENIGGYEFDIFNKIYESPKLIENSLKLPTFIKGIENKEYLFVTNNIIGAIYFSELSNVAYVSDFEDISKIENITAKKDFKEICFIINNKDKVLDIQTEKGQNFSKELNYLQNKLPKTKISVERNFKADIFNLLLKDEYIKKHFKPKEKGNNEELYKYLLDNTSLPKNKILELIKEDHIYQDVDKNMVFLVKNENGENIGGYEFDIYNSKEIKLLENSYISDMEKNEIINFAEYIKNDLEKVEEIQEEIEME